MHSGKKVTTFKERLSDLFSETALTDTEIADKLKVSKQTISAWKCGTRSPKEPTIISIAQYFHVNVEWLMGFDVEKYGPLMEQKQSQATGTENARISLVARGMSDMTEEQQKRFCDMARAAFPDIFGSEDNLK